MPTYDMFVRIAQFLTVAVSCSVVFFYVIAPGIMPCSICRSRSHTTPRCPHVGRRF